MPSAADRPEPNRQQVLQALLQDRRAALLARREVHLAGQSRAEHAREVLLQDGDDATQRDAERELDLALSDRDAVDLAAVEAAMQRLDQGRLGECLDCGVEIPLQRMQLEPAALRCVGCETRHERGAPRSSTL